MAKLLPFRDYDEHDVLNLFAFDYAGTDVTRGALVKIKSSAGWNAAQELDQSNSMVGFTLNNVVSDRYAVSARVQLAGSGDNPLGMLLYDVAETDENGEKLIYNPRKAAEMQTTVSGQAVPILTKGIVLVSGIDGTVAEGGLAYCGTGSADGGITATAGGTKKKIGRFLGTTGANGEALLHLDVNIDL